MSRIFERLMALEKCVILFDEIEEFCLDREDKSLSMESRMLTTAMLTQVGIEDVVGIEDLILVCRIGI